MKELIKLNEIEAPEQERLITKLSYIDDTLGGGITKGSSILFAGLPGAGKSTLLMQLSDELSNGMGKKVLYISGEESVEQVKRRAERLGVNSSRVYLTQGVKVEGVIKQIRDISPDLVIIDSLQMLHSSYTNTAPGTPSQIRYALMTLCELAKNEGITIIFIGHSTKAGYISGLQTYQHMVDVVLFLGVNEDHTRFAEVIKNRYGATGRSKPLYMTPFGVADNPKGPKGRRKIDRNIKVVDMANHTGFMKPVTRVITTYIEKKAKAKYGEDKTLSEAETMDLAGRNLFARAAIGATIMATKYAL